VPDEVKVDTPTMPEVSPPPIALQALPLYPSNAVSSLLNRMYPELGDPSLCAVDPVGNIPDPVGEVFATKLPCETRKLLSI